MPNRSLARVVPGLLIVAVGLILLLHNLDIVGIGTLRQFWPLILVAFGLQLMFDRADRALGLVLVVVGTVLQLRTLGLLYLDWDLIWDFWPLILVFVGIGLIIKRSGRDNTVGGVVLITLGVFFLGSNLQIFRFELWELWPVAVIALGVVMIRRAMGR